MKKVIASSILLTILLTFLTSCTDIIFYNTWHPVNQPMTKWIAEGVELYILGSEKDSFMIVDHGNIKMTYRVGFGHNYSSVLVAQDIHESFYYGKPPYGHAEDYIWHNRIYSWEVDLKSQTKFVLGYGYEEKVPGGGYNIPELLFPTELVFERVATNLTDEDIPQIEINEQYGFCPTYCEISQWISNDRQMIMKINSGAECQMASDPDAQFHVNFFESNASAYLTKITDENVNSPQSSLTISQSTEEWKCEYFEDHFLATVVRSEYYEPGQILTFTLLPPSTESETNSTMEENIWDKITFWN